jgi:hypothetical protein
MLLLPQFADEIPDSVFVIPYPLEFPNLFEAQSRPHTPPLINKWEREAAPSEVFNPDPCLP